MIALLPLLLATASVADTDARRPVSRVAVASVTIIAAERVEVNPPPAQGKEQDRQYRRRDTVPMVEFF